MNKLSAALTRNPGLPRFLCHLHQRLRQQRLNLVTGAGISVEAKVPAWKELLRRLAEIQPPFLDDFSAHEKAGLQPEYLGQIIYHRFNRACTVEKPADQRQAQVEYNWGEAIHKAIYKDVPEKLQDVLKNHPYLNQLSNLARCVPLVINFNFDDLLSEAIGEQIKSEVAAGNKLNALSVTWQPPLTDRHALTTVYHVNGILPRVSLKKRSPKLIFTEDSFADARARSPSVNAEYLFLRFVQNTMLLIGHSLGDSSLKNYLRKNRDKRPANHHYMIHWIGTDDQYPKERRDDIFEANLQLYNLITIFLTSEEISDFLNTLMLEDRSFANLVEAFDPDRRATFHYYIVGPVAAGKSTLLEHLRCFETHEEWTQPPPKEMYYASTKVGADEQAIIDRFLYQELKEKNLRMHNAPVGLHFMDRAPLDLYAFSKSKEENKKKTAELRNNITRTKPLQEGEILFIEAETRTLVKRNMARGRPPESAGSDDYFNQQIKVLKEIYDPKFLLSTDEFNSGEVARRVARHALLGSYTPTDLNAIMERYE